MTALLFSISLKGFFFFFGKIEVWVFFVCLYIGMIGRLKQML